MRRHEASTERPPAPVDAPTRVESGGKRHVSALMGQIPTWKKVAQERALLSDAVTDLFGKDQRPIAVVVPTATGDRSIAYLGHKNYAPGDLQGMAASFSQTKPVENAIKQGLLAPADILAQLTAQHEALGAEAFVQRAQAQAVLSRAMDKARNDAGVYLEDQLKVRLPGTEVEAAPVPVGVAQELYDTLQQEMALKAARIAELEAQVPTERVVTKEIEGPIEYRPSRRAILGGVAAGAGGLAAAMALADYLAQQGVQQQSNAAYSAQQAAANAY